MPSPNLLELQLPSAVVRVQGPAARPWEIEFDVVEAELALEDLVLHHSEKGPDGQIQVDRDKVFSGLRNWLIQKFPNVKFEPSDIWFLHNAIRAGFGAYKKKLDDMLPSLSTTASTPSSSPSQSLESSSQSFPFSLPGMKSASEPSPEKSPPPESTT